MGFERVAGICATTRGFKDFSAEPSNYDCDLFAPLFARIAALSGRTYTGTVPAGRGRACASRSRPTSRSACSPTTPAACRCAISDGILPGNEGRNYVIRRILRRAALYGRQLGLATGFFEELVAPVVESLGGVFPELRRQEADPAPRDPVRGGELRAGPGARPASASTRPRRPGALPGPGRLRALRHLRLPARPDPADRARARPDRRRRRDSRRSWTSSASAGRAAQKKEVIVAATEGGRRGRAGPDRLHRLRARPVEGHARDPGRRGPGRRTDVFLVFDRTPVLRRDGRPGGRHRPRARRGPALEIADTVKDKSGRHLHRVARRRAACPPPGAPAELSRRPRAPARHPAPPHGDPPAALGPAQGARHARPPGRLAQRARPAALRLLALRGGDARPAPRDRGAREPAGPRQREGRGLRGRIRQEARGHPRLLRREIRQGRPRRRHRRLQPRALRRHPRGEHGRDRPRQDRPRGRDRRGHAAHRGRRRRRGLPLRAPGVRHGRVRRRSSLGAPRERPRGQARRPARREGGVREAADARSSRGPRRASPGDIAAKARRGRRPEVRRPPRSPSNRPTRCAPSGSQVLAKLGEGVVVLAAVIGDKAAVVGLLLRRRPSRPATTPARS